MSRDGYPKKVGLEKVSFKIFQTWLGRYIYVSICLIQECKAFKIFEHPRKLKPTEAEVHFKISANRKTMRTISGSMLVKFGKSTRLILTGVRRWSRNASQMLRFLHPQIAA